MTLWRICMACILFLSWVHQCLKVEEDEEWWGITGDFNAEAQQRFHRSHSTPFSVCTLRISQLMAILTQNTKTVSISECCFKNPKPLSSFTSQTSLSHPLQLIRLTFQKVVRMQQAEGPCLEGKLFRGIGRTKSSSTLKLAFMFQRPSR